MTTFPKAIIQMGKASCEVSQPPQLSPMTPSDVCSKSPEILLCIIKVEFTSPLATIHLSSSQESLVGKNAKKHTPFFYVKPFTDLKLDRNLLWLFENNSNFKRKERKKENLGNATKLLRRELGRLKRNHATSSPLFEN